VSALLIPTVPTCYTLDDDAREPKAVNDRLGIYTRFANFLGCAVHAIPAGLRPDGLPFGVQLVMARGCDRELDALALPLERALSQGMGKARTPLPPLPKAPSNAAAGYVRVAVVGAHLRGLPLHHQLLSARARFVRTARTAPSYKLYALPNTTPKKPGLARVASGGASIEIELYDLPLASFGAFVAAIPPPLGIGTLSCDSGEQVKGFLCEQHALDGAEDISHHGGFRAYLKATSPKA
jgi:allophanate hydrolase